MQAVDLDNKIDLLASQFDYSYSNKCNYKELWSTIKEISSDFKNTSYPSSDKRNESWMKFQAIIQRVKDRQANEYEKRNNLIAESSSHLYKLESLADSAGPISGLYDVALFVATGGLSLITKMALEALLGKSDEEHERLRERSEIMKTAWNYLSDHKTKMTGRDKAKAYELLQKTGSQLDSDWQRWKVQRNKIFITRLEKAECKLEEALSHRQEHLDELISKYENARPGNYRDRVEDWIDKERDNIANIEAKLDNVRVKLSEIRAALES